MSLKQQPQVKYRKDYRPSQFLIPSTKLKFELYEDFSIVDAELQFVRNPADPRAGIEPLQLDGVDLTLLDIHMDGRPLAEDAYELNAEGLLLHSPKESFVLTTRVKIFPQQNTSLEGLYTSAGKFCTQCEAEGFRKITFYLDRPEIMSLFDVRIEADAHQYPLLLSNGNPMAAGTLDNGRHYREWRDPFPKPCYLFALVAGDLDCLEDEFVTLSGRRVKLQLFVDKGKQDQCEFAMDSLKRAMGWDEKKYGREYDLDLYMIVAVGDFNMGAMENKGLNIFNTKYVLANEKTATDTDFEGVERVIAHEYFHNWTGNRVTCRDWFQLSLKEGLTVFRDQQFSEDMRSPTVQRIDQVKIIRSAQFAEDAGPMAHPIRPDSYIEMNNFYTVTVYNKGAEVIRMMHTILGENGFRKGMDLYFERHDGQAVTCEDFIKAMEDANNLDWTQFRRWYSQAGTPRLKINLRAVSDGEFELVASQSCPPTPGQEEKAPFVIPLKWGLIGEDGDAISFETDENQILQEHLWLISESSQQLRFRCASKNPIPSLLRDFSAPVILEYDYTNQQLNQLLSADPNDFNRWDAGQKLMTNLILDDSPNIEETELEQLSKALLRVLENSAIDNALKALIVTPPTLSALLALSDRVNFDQLQTKHKQLRVYIASSLERQWVSIFNSLSGDTAQERAIRNVALHYLMLADSKQHKTLATQQIKSATNMTDELAALNCICKTENGFESELVQSFYNKWQHEDLVLDKWFAAQMLNEYPNVLQRLTVLMGHEKFSLENPNKVRALIGTFCGANLTQFHRADGAGYELLGHIVRKLDPINPQVAANLCKQFNVWKKLDVNRQALIKEQLGLIQSQPGLSNDVFEVVNKSLSE